MFQKINNIKGYLKIGIIANGFFILFIIVCMVYYSIYLKTEIQSNLVEGIAYGLEAIGFILMAVYIVGFVGKLKDRNLLKGALIVYFITELCIILMDFNFLDIEDAYNPSSKILIISHSIFSGLVLFSHITFDSKQISLQIATAVGTVISLCGVFCVAYGTRVYISILINAIAYVIYYSWVLYLIKTERVYIDCYGDVIEDIHY
ncbi:MAG: hypothetical protein LIO71_00685, partial [Ruminococcus sp.]|nr:hypothetical protein [Ruminococcus sp.]